MILSKNEFRVRDIIPMTLRLAQFKETALTACRHLYQDDLTTLAIFGSWARDAASPCSDIDILVIADHLPNGRMKRVAQFQTVENATFAARRLIWRNMPDTRAPELSPIIKTPREVEASSPLFLDMTDWIDLVFDRNIFFAGYLERLRRRLNELGARRRWTAGGYYWEYKPDIQPSEVLTL